MRYLLTILSVLSLFIITGCCANMGSSPNQAVSHIGNLKGTTSTSINAGQPNVTNITVNTCIKVVPADGTNINWTLFSEDNDIRCLPQYYGTMTNCPTSSVGYLVKGLGNPITAYPLTDPTFEWDCVATGSAGHVSLEIDKRQ